MRGQAPVAAATLDVAFLLCREDERPAVALYEDDLPFQRGRNDLSHGLLLFDSKRPISRERRPRRNATRSTAVPLNIQRRSSPASQRASSGSYVVAHATTTRKQH